MWKSKEVFRSKNKDMLRRGEERKRKEKDSYSNFEQRREEKRSKENVKEERTLRTSRRESIAWTLKPDQTLSNFELSLSFIYLFISLSLPLSLSLLYLSLYLSLSLSSSPFLPLSLILFLPPFLSISISISYYLSLLSSPSVYIYPSLCLACVVISTFTSFPFFTSFLRLLFTFFNSILLYSILFYSTQFFSDHSYFYPIFLCTFFYYFFECCAWLNCLVSIKGDIRAFSIAA